MKFDSLKERMEYYRSLTDYKLMPNSYVLVMLDGRGFSKAIKRKFELPYDDTFIDFMNQTAKAVCKEVQGCKFAYVQSDEISLMLTDFDTPTTDSFFGYRLCKMQSIIASIATAKFNQLMLKYELEHGRQINEIESAPMYQFDCKAWTVPNDNDAFAWFLYRQNDCVRNSKQAFAQKYFNHKDLAGVKVDGQIEAVKQLMGLDWNDESDGHKYGRFLYRNVNTIYFDDDPTPHHHTYWAINDAWQLNTPEGKAKFFNYNEE